MIEYKFCKTCKFKIAHISNGFFPNAKYVRYVDELGRQWNGKNCGKCHALKAKERAQKKVAAKNDQNP